MMKTVIAIKRVSLKELDIMRGFRFGDVFYLKGGDDDNFTNCFVCYGYSEFDKNYFKAYIGENELVEPIDTTIIFNV